MMRDGDIGIRIVTSARRWIGVRFRSGGSDRTGIDCVHLILEAYREHLLLHAPPPHYPKRSPATTVFATIRQFAERIPARLARPGDILLVRLANGDAHFGILTDRGILHASANARRVVEHAIPDDQAGFKVAAHYRLRTS